VVVSSPWRVLIGTTYPVSIDRWLYQTVINKKWRRMTDDDDGLCCRQCGRYGFLSNRALTLHQTRFCIAVASFLCLCHLVFLEHIVFEEHVRTSDDPRCSPTSKARSTELWFSRCVQPQLFHICFHIFVCFSDNSHAVPHSSL